MRACGNNGAIWLMSFVVVFDVSVCVSRSSCRFAVTLISLCLSVEVYVGLFRLSRCLCH